MSSQSASATGECLESFLLLPFAALLSRAAWIEDLAEPSSVGSTSGIAGVSGNGESSEYWNARPTSSSERLLTFSGSSGNGYR